MFIIVYMSVQDVYYVYQRVYVYTGRITCLSLCICLHMTYNMFIIVYMPAHNV